MAFEIPAQLTDLVIETFHKCHRKALEPRSRKTGTNRAISVVKFFPHNTSRLCSPEHGDLTRRVPATHHRFFGEESVWMACWNREGSLGKGASSLAISLLRTPPERLLRRTARWDHAKAHGEIRAETI